MRGEELLLTVGATQLPPDVEHGDFTEQDGKLLRGDQRTSHAVDHRTAAQENGSGSPIIDTAWARSAVSPRR